jgi:dTDP-4-dehydrorhamnose 3,5-epimerase
MIFRQTPLNGAYTIELEPRGDSRGFFARQFCQKEFAEHNLVTQFVQVNNSLSESRGTLRGLHYQLAPHSETKVIRCIRGAIWDCILDLRPSSESFGRWFGSELSADNRRMMYVPKGFAHGFISLTDDAELFYFVDEFYDQSSERGILWNDAKFAIDWPIQPTVISERDRSHPRFDEGYHGNPNPAIK